MSARHQEGLAHLFYGITVGGGFVALTGEVGTGKTTLCHCLLQQLPGDIDLALILNPKLNAVELLAAIVDELGIGYEKTSPTLKNLVDLLNQHLLAVHASGRRTVLLIDEAQNLSFEVLEQIRLLTNLETSKSKLLQIILVGQPELQQLLKQKRLRQLNQRITARYHLLPLSYTETEAYIRHRLSLCNGDEKLFNRSAVRKIYQFSSGIPRLINILCDRALLGAYSSDARLITAKIVKRAAKEVLAAPDSKLSRLAFLSALLALTSVAAIFYYANRTLPPAAPITPKPSSPLVQASATPMPVPLIAAAAKLTQTAAATPSAPSVQFSDWIVNPKFTLSGALRNTLIIWGKQPPAPHPTDCHDAEALMLNCLSGHASWQSILAMNRPVILEFLVAGKQKRYVVLTGLRNRQNVAKFYDQAEFAVAEITRFWTGNYWLLWKSPRSDMKGIYPSYRSENVLWLRQQLNLANNTQEVSENPEFFDPHLKKQVMDFQRQNHLFADGIAGARTILYLDNLTGSTDSPHLNLSD